MADGSLIFDTKLDTKGVSTGLKNIGSAAMTTFAGVGTVLAAGATAMGFLVKNSLDAHASVEQSIGGIETLFGTAGLSIEEYAKTAGKSVEAVSAEYTELSRVEALMLDNAKQAYATAGMSADNYMKTVTSFAASLKQSTGDNAEAAKVANQAVIDMSDNANKMGTSMESIQNAYQGFAKQNYTMLDNLKLGYGGTKTEMERLLKDATKLSGVKYDIGNLADVYSAIHVVQTELGITGTTAKEASQTIEGSANAMKAAWDNFMGGMGGASEVVSTVVTFAGNATNKALEIIKGFSKELPKIMEGLKEVIPSFITDNLPVFLDAAVVLITSIADVLPGIVVDILPILIDSLIQLMNVLIPVLPNILKQLLPSLFYSISELFLALIPMLPSVLTQLITLIIEMLPPIIDQLIAALPMILDVLAEMLPEILVALADALIVIGESIIKGLFEHGPALLESGIKLIMKFIEGIDSMFSSISAAANAVGKWAVDSIWNGIKAFWSMIVNGVSGLVTQVWDKFTFEVKRFTEIGKSIVDGIWSGISSGWSWLTESIGNLAGGLLNSAKKALGINSPSKKFKWIGEMCVVGFEEGIEDLMDGSTIGRAVDASLNTVNSNLKGATLTIDGAIAGSSNTFNFYDTQTSPDAIKRKFDNTMTFGLAGGIR